MRTKIYSILLILLTHSTIKAQEQLQSVEFGGTYTGDVVHNFKGGIKTGTSYLGMATINAYFESEKANWWKGGEAFINLANTHGGEPAATLIGDFQGVSNIEAGNLTWMYEFWYKQTIANFSLIVGLQDLNSNFASCENSTLFTNSSLGIHSSIADNITSPIFPLTALGLQLGWEFNENYSLKAAIYDGTPDNFENNPFNVNWRLNKNDGYLVIAELDLTKSLIKNMNGCYKLGIYTHKHINTIDVNERNEGIYLVGNQQLTQHISAFSQLGFSPKSINQNNHYYSLGLKLNNFSNKRKYDEMGIALAHAGIDNNGIGDETALEFTYQFQLCSNIFIRPDIQYIINPAGTDKKLDNALVGLVRFGLEF